MSNILCSLSLGIIMYLWYRSRILSCLGLPQRHAICWLWAKPLVPQRARRSFQRAQAQNIWESNQGDHYFSHHREPPQKRGGKSNVSHFSRVQEGWQQIWSGEPFQQPASHQYNLAFPGRLWEEQGLLRKYSSSSLSNCSCPGKMALEPFYWATWEWLLL